MSRDTILETLLGTGGIVIVIAIIVGLIVGFAFLIKMRTKVKEHFKRTATRCVEVRNGSNMKCAKTISI